MFKKFIKKCAGWAATISFTTGKVLATAGQVIFLLKEGLDYFNIKSPAVTIPTLAIGAASTAYIRGVTRGPAMKKIFLPDSDQAAAAASPIWKNTTRLEKTNVVIMWLSNFGSLGVEFLASFLGSYTLLTALQIEELLEKTFGDEAGDDIGIGIDLYFALSCAVAYAAFFCVPAVRNALDLQRNLTTASVNANNRATIAGNLIKTTASSGLAGSATVVMGGFSVYNALNLIWPTIPKSLVATSVVIGSTSVFVTYLMSRSGQTYKYYNANETALIKVVQHSLSGFKDKTIAMAQWGAGAIDMASFAAAAYGSFLGSASALGYEDSWVAELTPLLFCLSIAITHWIFSIRPLVLQTIKNRDSYQAEAILPSPGKSRFCCFGNNREETLALKDANDFTPVPGNSSINDTASTASL
jgi:hypothetical protein